MDEVTKEQIAELWGKKPEEITDEELAEIRAEAGKTDNVVVESVESDDPVFKLSELREKDPFAEDYPLRERLIERLKDPINDTSHPNHKLIKDNQIAARSALEAKAKAEAELQELQITLAEFMADDKSLNDPVNEVYGGLSRERIRSGVDEDHSEMDWLLAKQKFEKTQSIGQRISQSRSAGISETWRNLDTESESLRKTQADADVDSILRRFVPIDRTGKPNADYRPLTFQEGLLVTQIDKQGGFENLKTSLIDEGKKLGRQEVLDVIAKRKTGPITNNKGGSTRPLLNVKLPATEDEFHKLPDEQQQKVADEILGPTQSYKPIFAFRS